MNKGFTLIELLIVVAIIGILAAVGAAVIPNLLKNAKVTVSDTQFNSTVKSIRTDFIKCEIDSSGRIKFKSFQGGPIYDLSCGQFNEGNWMDGWYDDAKCSGMYYSNEYKSPFHPFTSGSGMGDVTCGRGMATSSTNEGVIRLQGKNQTANGCVVVSMYLQNEVLKKEICQQN